VNRFVNNPFEYYDTSKVLHSLVEHLKLEIEGRDLLTLKSLQIESIEVDHIVIGVSDQIAIDQVRERNLEPRIISFLSHNIYKNSSVEIRYKITEPRDLGPAHKRHHNLSQPSLKDSKSALVPKPSPLNPYFTFDSFVQGATNRYAYASAQAMARRPGAQLGNPLFIYGAVGLGKTHLLHAIAHQIRMDFPERAVHLISCESLMNLYLAALKKKDLPELRKIRNVDVLLVDDVQFLKGKDAFQEEFFNTFNYLSERQSSIVLAADRTPVQIEGLTDRLLSRFRGGVVADIKLPDLETRMVIINNLAERNKVSLASEAVEHLARSISSNVRELQGAFIKMVTKASFENRAINRSLIDEVLFDYDTERPQLSPEIIQQEVANSYDISLKDLLSDRRDHKVAYPRQVAMYLVKEMTSLTLKDIATCFNRREHGTVINSCKKVQKRIKNDRERRIKVSEIHSRLNKNYER
jgi:chromosomal replication initiator protein